MPNRRKVAVLLLSVILAFPWVEQAWSFLTSVWSEEGCPNGVCRPEPTPTIDSGCHIDPSGGCSS